MTSPMKSKDTEFTEVARKSSSSGIQIGRRMSNQNLSIRRESASKFTDGDSEILRVSRRTSASEMAIGVQRRASASSMPNLFAGVAAPTENNVSRILVIMCVLMFPSNLNIPYFTRCLYMQMTH